MAYVLIGEMLLVIPQDAHLAALMERAGHAVTVAGLTADDYLAELPAVRDELMQERYAEVTGQRDSQDWTPNEVLRQTETEDAIGPAPSRSDV